MDLKDKKIITNSSDIFSTNKDNSAINEQFSCPCELFESIRQTPKDITRWRTSRKTPFSELHKNEEVLQRISTKLQRLKESKGKEVKSALNRNSEKFESGQHLKQKKVWIHPLGIHQKKYKKALNLSPEGN